MTTQTISIEQAFEMCLNRISMLEQRAANLERAHAQAHASAMKLRKRLCSIEATEAVRRTGRALEQSIEFSSQYGEDVVIWTLLGFPLTGFFIEVGAFDGRTLSGSFALEQMGWRGLLVEPIPELAEMCKASRPRSKVVHAAVGVAGSHGETSFTVTEGDWGKLLSFRGDPSESHQQKLNASNSKQRRITVPFTTLADLLEGCTDRVDAAIIDVEGLEAEVLDGLDIRQYRPRVLVVEDEVTNNQSDVMKLMSTYPDYVHAGILAGNRIFVRKDEREALDRMSLIA